MDLRSKFEDLPEEVLELIFEFICPYGDYKNCCLVCHKWRRVLKGVAHQRLRRFRKAVVTGRLKWRRFDKTNISPMISERYSHNACYIDGSIYVFGGCTASYTTFNDLWKFDMTTKRWLRPVANGAYPTPKACATMVVWKKQLVLFGGWSQAARPLHLHQAPQFFNQLHFYDTELNTWTKISCDLSPPPVGGHCACIISDHMIAFGGSHTYGTSTDELWSFDLVNMIWTRMKNIGDECEAPTSRYGAYMCQISDNQAMLVGGCGGPNMKYSDCYVLTLHSSSSGTWSRLQERCKENVCPPPFWYHPCCKVGDSIVLLCKTNLEVPPDVLTSISSYKEKKQTTVDPVQSSSTQNTGAIGYSSSSSDDEEVRTRSNLASSGGVRQRLNRRQQQLEALERYARQYQNHRHHRQHPQLGHIQGEGNSQLAQSHLLKNPMFLHSIDISTVAEGFVSWNKPNVVDVKGDVPEETHFYSLTEGRGDLFLCGGIFSEVVKRTPMQRLGHGTSTDQALNDSVYIISDWAD